MFSFIAKGSTFEIHATSILALPVWGVYSSILVHWSEKGGIYLGYQLLYLQYLYIFALVIFVYSIHLVLKHFKVKHKHPSLSKEMHFPALQLILRFSPQCARVTQCTRGLTFKRAPEGMCLSVK